MIQGQVVDGRFECINTTTRPEPGEAWVARDGNRDVVLRLLSATVKSDSQRKAFMKTAQAAMNMKGPTIEATLHAGFAGDNRPYVVTEKATGRSLAEELTAGQAFDVPRAIGIAIAIAEALAEAARRGICHGHLSSSVVWLAAGSRRGKRKSPDFRVKVLGFAPWDAGASNTVFNRDSAAPEVLDGATADIRSDCWSLGSILYRMLTGLQPERSGDIGEEKLSSRFRPPSATRPDAGITTGLDLLVLRLLETDPEKRMTTPEQLVTHMKDLLSGKTDDTGNDDGTSESPVPEVARDTVEDDLDEGISFASGRKVTTTSFAAPAAVKTGAAGNVGDPVPGIRSAAPVGVPAPAPVASGAVRSKGSSTVALVVLIGFFVLAAIAVTGWFVLQYQSRQLEIANIAATSKGSIAPAPVQPTPPPAQQVVAPVPQASPPAQQVVTPVPQASPPAQPLATEKPAEPVKADLQAAAPAPDKPATEIEAVEPAAKKAAKKPVTAKKPQKAPKAATATKAETAPKPAPKAKKAAAGSPNWNDGLDGDKPEKPAKKARKAEADSGSNTKPALDWGD